MKRASLFGKYLLLDRLNVGGMAEVFIAKAFGVEGLERYVAIKKILPSMAEDEEFIRMFIDEARISLQLNHANIVHIHELEKVGESFYLAMEYVPGKDVRTLLDRYRGLGEAMPVPQAVLIASKMCEGLHYAHTRKDARGQELGIIHRDVSPQNILVSYEGEVKIIDFGIAKAANRSQKTQAGILKGKFGYMSPEMVRGQPIDRRSDIFAVGVILYELLTGERLFTGESDYSVLEKVRAAQVPPPRELNPSIPLGLERVLMKALAREPDERYAWASDLQEDLIRFLLMGDQIFTSKNLSEFMKSAFAEDIAREDAAMEQYATVERPDAAGEETARGRSPVAPPEAEFGVDDEDESAGETQLLDPSGAGNLGLGASPDEASEATRFDLVNPFGDQVEQAAPGRGGRVVIGSGDAYSGATVIGAAPSRAEIPVSPVSDGATRLISGVVPASREEPAFLSGAEQTQTRRARSAIRPPGAPRPPQKVSHDAAGEAPAFGEDGADEVTGSISRPSPEKLAPPPRGTVQRPGPSWLPYAAIGAAALIALGLVAALRGSRHVQGQPLVVRVLQPEQALITVDRQPVKNGVVTLVPPGAHEVVVGAPGYRSETRTVTVTAGRMPPVVELSLESEGPASLPAVSPMTANAPPADAAAPAAAQAPAPAATGTPSGKAAVRTAASAPNTVPVAPKQPESEAPPAAKTFTARFDSSDDGVEMTVDGKSVGRTPGVTLAQLEVGKTYRFTAQRAGFKTGSGTFRSADGGDVVVPVTLEKAEAPLAQETRHMRRAAAGHAGSAHASGSKAVGRLAASTHPAGAEIWVDNRPTGRHTPVAPGSPLLLPVGRHQVTFKLGSKRSPAQQVIIDEKETTKLINVPLE